MLEYDFSEREQAANAADAANRPEKQQSAGAAHSAAARAGAEQQSLPLHACRSREAHGQHVTTREARAGVPECTGQGGGAGQAGQPGGPAQRRGSSGTRGGPVVLQLRGRHEAGLAVALTPQVSPSLPTVSLGPSNLTACPHTITRSFSLGSSIRSLLYICTVTVVYCRVYVLGAWQTVSE